MECKLFPAWQQQKVGSWRLPRSPSKLATELKTHYKFSLSPSAQKGSGGRQKVYHRGCHVVGGKRARKLSRIKLYSGVGEKNTVNSRWEVGLKWRDGFSRHESKARFASLEDAALPAREEKRAKVELGENSFASQKFYHFLFALPPKFSFNSSYYVPIPARFLPQVWKGNVVEHLLITAPSQNVIPLPGLSSLLKLSTFLCLRENSERWERRCHFKLILRGKANVRTLRSLSWLEILFFCQKVLKMHF